MKTIINLCLTFLLFNVCLAQKSDLSLNLEMGKSYTQEINSRSIITQEVSGQKIEIDMTNISSMSFLVKRLTDEGYDLEVKYDKIIMSVSTFGTTMEFNSEVRKDDDVFSAILSNLIDQPFEVTMTKKGRILELRNIDVLLEKVLAKFAEVPDMELAQYQSQLQNAFGEAAFRGSIEMFTAVYPNDSVKKGDKWNISTNLESGMTALVTSTYVLQDETPNYSLISGNSNLVTDTSAEIISSGITMSNDLKGTMSSEIKLDKKSGWIIEAIITQDLKGVSIVKPSEYIPEGMIIPVTISTKMTTKN
jgi:hypothetical protein